MIRGCLSITSFVCTAMKTILSFLFCLSFLCLKAQDKVPVIPQAEPGKEYATCVHPFDTLYEERGVLKVTFPRWESGTDTIFKTSENIQRVVVKSAATRWLFRYSDRNCLSAESSNCISLAYVEISPEIRNIHFTENDSFKIVQVERLTRSAALEWVAQSSIPSSDDFVEVKPYESGEYRYFKDETHQIIYVYSKSNKWRTWREVLCTCGGYPPYIVADIQQVLKQKGYYSDTISNVIDAPTKMAIVRFQKDNQLPIGSFDYETLRELDIIPKPNRIFYHLNEW